MTNLQMIHQNCVYTSSTPIQEAIAIGFELEQKRLGTPDCYFNSIGEELREKRDYMAEFLQEIGMNPTIPQGGYFMIADWSKLGKNIFINISIKLFFYLFIHFFQQTKSTYPRRPITKKTTNSLNT